MFFSIIYLFLSQLQYFAVSKSFLDKEFRSKKFRCNFIVVYYTVTSKAITDYSILIITVKNVCGLNNCRQTPKERGFLLYFQIFISSFDDIHICYFKKYVRYHYGLSQIITNKLFQIMIRIIEKKKVFWEGHIKANKSCQVSEEHYGKSDDGQYLLVAFIQV